MVGTIGAATSGFGGVAGYCCGGGGGGEEERERDETESLSARERQQEQEMHPPGRSADHRRDDEEERKRRAEEREREKKAEAAARKGRRVQWAETRNLAANDPMRGGADHGGDGAGRFGTQAAFRSEGDGPEVDEAALSLLAQLGEG